MKVKVKIIKQVEVKLIHLDAFVRYWEDSDINGEPDSNEEPKMPFAVKTKVSNGNPWRKEMVNGYRWRPKIDIDKGVIVDWPGDVEADIHYKVCDECHITIVDKDNQKVYDRESYVPNALCIGERGGGDYIIMHIDRDGKIKDWNPNKVKDFIECRDEDY